MYFDIFGTMKGQNKKTGETITLQFNPRSWTSDSSLEGNIMNKDGKKTHTI